MNYVDAELEKRGWSRHELSKRAGLSNSYFSMLASGSRGIGADACTKIAQALHLPTETVFGWAGLLPPDKSDPLVDEIMNIASRLPAEDQEELAEIARLKLNRYEKRTEAATRKP